MYDQVETKKSSPFERILFIDNEYLSSKTIKHIQKQDIVGTNQTNLSVNNWLELMRKRRSNKEFHFWFL